MTRLMLVLAVLMGAGATDASAQARTGRLASPALGGGERIFSILLPIGYTESQKRYPVVYLLHGGGQDHTAFMARTAFVPTARRHEVIAVMPAADRSFGNRAAEVQARYETFIATELVPHIDAQYRTIASQQGRAIGGISMGGGIAASTALRYPDIFGAVGALSASFRGTMPADITGIAPYFYVSCGTADTLLPQSRQLAQLLEMRKIPHEYREIPGGEHAWSVWDPQLAIFFDLLAKRDGWRAVDQR
jgi:enterochelin esterase-like enzyme